MAIRHAGEVSYVENLAIGGVFCEPRKKSSIRSLVQVLLTCRKDKCGGRGVCAAIRKHYGIAVHSSPWTRKTRKTHPPDPRSHSHRRITHSSSELLDFHFL